MEKIPLRRNMKDLHYGYNKVVNTSSPWNISNMEPCNKNIMTEIKWDSELLPRSTYTCSFCKREFKSAQALGGHMNVHRRDRARLRQLCYSPQSDTPVATWNNGIGQFPPRLNLNLDPNAMKFPHLPSKLLPPTDKENAAGDVPFFTDLVNGKRLFGVENFVQEKVVKKAVRVELEIGLISGSEEEVVDLELRLGYRT